MLLRSLIRLSIDVGADELSFDTDECFFMLIDRNGKWRINTILKGFADRLCGLASSYTTQVILF